MAHRKTVRHFHEVGHLHELTFSCYQRMPLLTNDTWREKLARCIESAGKETAFDLVGFRFHAGTRASDCISDYTESTDQLLSGPDQAAVLKTNKRRFSGTSFNVVVETDCSGKAWQVMLSVLASRAGLRSQPVFSRSHFVVLGIHPRQSS
jgi:hypothetical protein